MKYAFGTDINFYVYPSSQKFNQGLWSSEIVGLKNVASKWAYGTK